MSASSRLQVRNNAALALSTVAAAYYPLAGVEQFVIVWEALVQALENSQHQGDFSEYKHAATLRTQVCVYVCVCVCVCVISL